MAEEVEKVFDNMKKIIRTQPKDRTSVKPKERVEEFKSQVQRTMKFWPRNVMKILHNEEDSLYNL